MASSRQKVREWMEQADEARLQCVREMLEKFAAEMHATGRWWITHGTEQKDDGSVFVQVTKIDRQHNEFKTHCFEVVQDNDADLLQAFLVGLKG